MMQSHSKWFKSLITHQITPNQKRNMNQLRQINQL
jgi:hypothetical protein